VQVKASYLLTYLLTYLFNKNAFKSQANPVNVCCYIPFCSSDLNIDPMALIYARC